MKTFNNFNSAFNWVNDTVKEAYKEAIPLIAKQEYEDSKKYTYVDTQTMYDSGQDSDFEKGFVVIKAPQVRWLYYTTWIKAGKGNPNAVPQWHERVKSENMNDYIDIFNKKINQIKKG